MTNAQWVIQALNAVLGENIGSLPVAKQYFRINIFKLLMENKLILMNLLHICRY